MVGVAVSWFNTSRTGVSRHAGLMSQVIEDGARMIAHVIEGTPGDHRCRRGETTVAQVVRDFGVSRSWSTSCWPATAPRAPRRSNRGHAGPRPRRGSPLPRPSNSC
jgi:hypothetical protein